tara:strand:+ start:493 stop:1365 length:873 start_codon:yes stop_codon:yes gene_type:complete
MDELGSKQQTKLYNHNTRRGLSIYRKLFWAWPFQSHNNKSHDHYPKRNKYNQYVFKLISICLLGSTTPTFASDIGGVSATANPVANSSGSVTNQAIQVLQGPYITNTYGAGIQCQGPTMNLTPFITGNIAVKRPYEDTWMDPVYNNVDANNDDVPDNPGEILYYKPVRTGQKDSSTVSLGLSATWSKPLDKKLQDQCKQAAQANINFMVQNTANKRLDFEIARLKNCGELMKAGIMFHKNSPYFAVCADVVLVNPPGTLPNHSHSITKNPLPPTANGNASDLKNISIGNN